MFVGFVSRLSHSQTTSRRRPLHWPWLSAVAAIGLLCCAQAQAGVVALPFELELRVENVSSVHRQGEVVSSGVPLPRYVAGARSSLVGLSLFDEQGEPVPMQLEVLSRWGGLATNNTLPIKWLLVSFPVDVLAGGSRSFFLRDQPGLAAGQVNASFIDGVLTVDTGAMRVEFPSSGGSLLSGVWIDQVRVVEGGFLDLRDAGGVQVAAVLESSVIEVAGKVRTVVRQRISVPALGLAATLRYRLVTGSAELQVDLRLENNGAYGSPFEPLPSATTHFDSLELVLRLPAASSRVADHRQVYASGGSSFEVQQRYGLASSATAAMSGFNYDVLIDGVTVQASDRFAGGLATDQVTVVVDRFWQTFPKALAVEDQDLRIGLFPGFGNGPEFRGQYESPPDITGVGGSGSVLDPLDSTAFRFEGGRWSSHLLELGFRAVSQVDPEQVAERVEALAQPLMALPADERWVFEVFAFGEIQIPRLQDLYQRFEQMQEVLVDDAAADQVSGLGRIGLRGYRDRGGRWGGRQMYGWQNFGDLSGAYGYSGGHYDLAFSVLINYFRTGDRRFLDTGRDLIHHRRDYDQYHSRDLADPRRGGQFLDKGFWHGNSGAPSGTAIWVHGLLLWHVMTGDPGAREAAVEVGEFIGRQSPETWSGYWGAAQIGWQLEALVHLYNYLGDESYLEQAKLVVERWVELEQSQPSCGAALGCGYVLNPGFNPGSNNVPSEFEPFYSQSATIPGYQPASHAVVAMAMAKLYFIDLDVAVYRALSRLGGQLSAQALVAADVDAATGPWVHGRLCFASAEPLSEPSFSLDPSTHDGWAVITALVYHDFVEAMVQGVALSPSSQSAFQALYNFLFDSFLMPPTSVILPAVLSPIGWHPSASSGTQEHAQRALWGLQLTALVKLYAQIIELGESIIIQVDPTAPRS